MFYLITIFLISAIQAAEIDSSFSLDRTAGGDTSAVTPEQVRATTIDSRENLTKPGSSNSKPPGSNREKLRKLVSSGWKGIKKRVNWAIGKAKNIFWKNESSKPTSDTTGNEGVRNETETKNSPSSNAEDSVIVSNDGGNGAGNTFIENKNMSVGAEIPNESTTDTSVSADVNQGINNS
jgi:hypothetical protein